MLRSLQLFQQRMAKVAVRVPIQAASDFASKYEEPTLRSRRGERCLNQVTLLGRVGGDPVVVGINENIVKFNLATNEYLKVPMAQDDPDNVATQENAWKQITSWHQIVVYRPYLRDSIARLAKRGQRVLVTGRLEYRRFEDSETAATVQKTNIVADDIVYLSRSEDVEQE